MRAAVRAAVATVIALGALGSAAAVANADSTTDPCEVRNGYVPPATCQVLVETSSSCTSSGTGQLTYAVTGSAAGTASTVTVSLKDKNGHSAVLSGEPLSGTVTWPSTVNAGGAVATFTTEGTPAYTVSSSVSTPACVAEVLAAGGTTSTTSTTTVSKVLAATGANEVELGLLAVGLVGVGVGAVALGRRRRSAR